MSLRTLLLLSVLAAVASGCDQTPTTYAAHCATPLAHWGRETDGIGHLRTVQPIYVGADGSIIWNKVVISDATLRRYMVRMSAMNPAPQAVLDISAAASCSRVAAVRAIMDAAPLCKGPRSLCSEGAHWEQWPEVGGP